MLFRSRIEQPDTPDRTLQVAVDDVRLDDGDEIQFVDLENAIEPGHRQHDAAAGGYSAARVARASPANDERYALLIAEPRDRGDLRCRSWNHDQVRGMSLAEGISRVRCQ